MSGSSGVYVAAGVVMLALVGNVQAQPPMPSHYSARSGNGELHLHLRKRGHSWASVGTRCCGGKVAGWARVSARGVTIRRSNIDLPDDFPDHLKRCVLRVTFSRNYTRAKITESNCVPWHGASCDFENVTLHRQN
jgi:hypothetical protein